MYIIDGFTSVAKRHFAGNRLETPGSAEPCTNNVSAVRLTVNSSPEGRRLLNRG